MCHADVYEHDMLSVHYMLTVSSDRSAYHQHST